MPRGECSRSKPGTRELLESRGEDLDPSTYKPITLADNLSGKLLVKV